MNYKIRYGRHLLSYWTITQMASTHILCKSILYVLDVEVDGNDDEDEDEFEER